MRVFENCRQRVERANFHNDAAARIWNEVAEDNRERISVQVNRKGEGNIYLRMDDLAHVLSSISLELGEMFYQLRAALDGCIYEAAVAESGQNPPPDEHALLFPIAPTEADFKKSARRISGLSDVLKNFIESIQPYNAPKMSDDLRVANVHRTLFILNDWARIDRHRRLHVVGIMPTAVDPIFDLPDGMSIAYVNVRTGGFLRDGDEIASFGIDAFQPNSKINVNPNFRFEIALNETPGPCSRNDILGERIRQMQLCVATIVKTFEDFS